MNPPDPARRGSRGPQRGLTRTQIVLAAVGLADAEGLDAASMRRIAAEVGAGAMTLYQYIPNREDLLELMVDEVYGDLDTSDDTSTDWRAAMETRAHRLRALWRDHPWLATWLPGHPTWGPNSLAYHEWMLAVFDEFDISTDEMVSLLGVLRGYVESFVRAEVGADEEERRTKRSQREWIANAEPHAVEIVRSGKYPRYSRVLTETTGPLLDPDVAFTFGMQRVIDAIEARLQQAQHVDTELQSTPRP